MSESVEKQYYVSSKNRLSAMILACLGFLGIAGLHRLYVGKTLSGVIYAITGGVFLLGTIYDLYKLYCESFKDSDGFPLYSDASMKSNYHRRNPHKKTGVIAWFFVCIWGLAIFSGTFLEANRDRQATNKNVVQNDNSEKSSAKKETGPILDISMTGTPVENITNTVKTNAPKDGNIVDLKYVDTKVDTSSGKAKVEVYLHGARGLTINGTLGSFNEAAKQIVAALYQVNPGIEIENVKVIVSMDVTDSGTGAEKTIPAYSLSMSANRAKQMHWDNYKKINMSDAADKIELHPSLKQEIKRNSGKSSIKESLDTLGI